MPTIYISGLSDTNAAAIMSEAIYYDIEKNAQIAGAFSGSESLGALNDRYGHLDATDLLRPLLTEVFRGRIAVSSSFGAESAVILHMVSEIANHTPILFIDTGKLFSETLAYRDQLTSHLGLTNVQIITPEYVTEKKLDPDGELWRQKPDLCCAFRKTAPLERALERFDAWITGRKRYQADTRGELPVFESKDGRIKINPLARWTPSRLSAYMDEHSLPKHSLVEQGYLSIGCAPCTTPVAPGENPRAGRWRGTEKTECGIHMVNGRLIPANANTIKLGS